MKSTLFLLGIGLVILGLFLFMQKSIQVEKPVTITPTPVLSQTPKPTLEKVKVARVVDGDTIVLESGQKLRYIGIDTPETKDPRKPVQCFGKEASAKNKELVEGRQVELEKDVSETDKYGRLLRYVYLTGSQPPNDTVSSGQIFVNEYLVRQGYAHAATFPPDVKYQELFKAAEREARENNRGLWSACP